MRQGLLLHAGQQEGYVVLSECEYSGESLELMLMIARS